MPPSLFVLRRRVEAPFPHFTIEGEERTFPAPYFPPPNFSKPTGELSFPPPILASLHLLHGFFSKASAQDFSENSFRSRVFSGPYL